MTSPLLQIEDLRIARSEKFCLTVKRVDVTTGRLLCITGPNGSGKSTLIECMCGLLVPTTGTVSFNGEPLIGNLRLLKATSGYIPDDEDWFIKELSAKEYFSLLKTVYQSAGKQGDMDQAISELALKLRFNNFDEPLQKLSHGNKKKVQIIAALMHDPELIIMDEVRNGLDPLAIQAVELIIKEAVKAGKSIVVATHDLWWAERLADDVLVLDRGGVVLQAPMKDVLQSHEHLETAFMKLVSS